MAALDVDALKGKATAAFNAFSPAQLVVVGLLSVVALVGGFAFLHWVNKPTYGVLLSGLDAKDAAAVTAQLDAAGVTYQLQGGNTVLVPESEVAAQRLKVAAAGLPAGKTDAGWAAFDSQGMTSSSFQQQVAYQRAIEGTLGQTLGQIDGVRSAQVHLALPEKKLFTEQAQPARASVLVETDATLSDNAVDAMTHLVSSAVPGLAAGDVSITDSSGNLLTAGGATGSGDRSNRQRQAYEDALSARATSMIDAVVGPGHAVVRVSAEVDLAEKTVDSESYDPTKSVVLGSSERSEVYTPGADPAATTSGVISLPAAVATTTPITGSGSTSGAYTKTEADKTNGTSRTVEHSVQAPGGVKRLTVAVVVDDNAKNAPAIAELESLVGNAVGLDPARGDTIAVTKPSFVVDTATKAAAAKAGGPLDMVTRYGGQALGGLLLLLVGLGLLRSLKRGMSSEVSEDEVSAALAGAVPAELSAGSAQAALPAGSLAAGELESAVESSDEVAALLRGWLAGAPS